MWATILPGLLIAILLGWILTSLLQARRIRQLERSKEEIQIEETLVFDFLHGLGEAFTETIRATDLHRLIVEGATRILYANGGALYLMERAGGKLAPAYVSKGCPPLMEIPEHVSAQAASTPSAVESYSRLHVIAPGDGIIGRVWETRESVLTVDSAGASIMVAPLMYAKQNMGVLALGNVRKSAPFSASDFVFYKSIA